MDAKSEKSFADRVRRAASKASPERLEKFSKKMEAYERRNTIGHKLGSPSYMRGLKAARARYITNSVKSDKVIAQERVRAKASPNALQRGTNAPKATSRSSGGWQKGPKGGTYKMVGGKKVYK